MPKVDSIDIRIEGYQKYNVYYKPKEGFCIKSSDLPAEFISLMGEFKGYKTFESLQDAVLIAAVKYQELAETTAIVIRYGASASNDILMNSDGGGVAYFGYLPNCSKKIKPVLKKTSVGIDYGIFKKYSRPDGRHLYKPFDVFTEKVLDNYGNHGFDFSNEIPYTAESYAFFEAMKKAMANMVIQLSKVIDATPEQFAVIAENRAKMLGAGEENQNQ